MKTGTTPAGVGAKKLPSKRFHVGQNFKILIERQKHYFDLTVLSIIVKRCERKNK